ncbi:CLUMA_CG017814, isoform A [Clunio marinus]|uniref:CLUMA_CG017814, isoform A n=1 Tax=Clunio marinus TaxID=568069 RepID=A0A1J1IYI1_9DIPT|nr:CLUMA_CG017814, isoform A [Clunio marinus]
MSSLDPKIYNLSEKVANLHYFNLLPFNENGQVETREFLQKIVDILMDYVELTFNREEPVLDFYQPENLHEKFDMKISDEGFPLQQLIIDCARTLKHQVKSGHPRFMNQLSNGLDMVAMAGEWLTATANSNMFTYEVSPVFILMEHEVLAKMRELIGFTVGDSILAPGGSICNLYSVLLARYHKFPGVKLKGSAILPGELVIFTSDQCHYSIKTAAAITGIGIHNCIFVPSDFHGRMIPEELERLIKEQKEKGKIPIMAIATAGTTVLGAFDPLASWGGGLLFSHKHRHPRLTGIELADSVTWNAHKLMGSTLQCATFHTKHDGILKDCDKVSAEYLFMTDKFYDTQYDTGDRVIQCGRHNDVFKLWLQWRARGNVGFERRVDQFMDLAHYHVQRLKEKSETFHLLMDPEFVNICFWYIPKHLRGTPHNEEKTAAMGQLCPKIKSRMMKAGTLMVGYTRDGRVPNFFRSVISNEAVTEKDIDFLMAEIERLGDDL